MSDSQERTEKATAKRMKEVRSKGQLAKSQDVTAWLGMGAAAAMIPATIAAGTQAATSQLVSIGSVISNPNSSSAQKLLGDSMASILPTVGPLLGVVAVVILVGAAGQGGIHFKQMTAKVDQFNLLAGVKNTFGMQALWGGVKALFKTIVVGIVLYTVIQGLMPTLMEAGGLPISQLIAAAGAGTGALLQYAIAAGLALAAVDVFVVMRRNLKKTRMSKKEVTDESKSSEGDPLIRSQRRARQLAMSRNRMMSAVATADVVLVNPIHVAVALKYEPGKSAPRVVAKGQGTVAARIRERAEEEGVPMVRDVPLARALHAACELGEEIPTELYDAVAKVLAFVMALNARGAAKGMHTIVPTPPAQFRPALSPSTPQMSQSAS